MMSTSALATIICARRETPTRGKCLIVHSSLTLRFWRLCPLMHKNRDLCNVGFLQSDRPCSIIMKVIKSVAELVLLLKWMRSTEAVSADGLADNEFLHPITSCASEVSPTVLAISPLKRGGCRA